ncbi:MAG: hypothetical protein KGI93_09585, partial [Acidobacteriota bacterium]|nr:hypothetical protein [Acidobacteriota bacterium]
ASLASALRGTAARRRPKRARALGLSVPSEAGRAGAAALAAAFAGWTAASVPFFPHGWPVGLALAAAALTAYRPRTGLAFALAVPVLPLGNDSLGLAVAYGALALAWLLLSWREPRGGLLFALGPLLAPVSAIALVPLAAATLRAGPRRAAQAAAAVLVAAVVAGVRHVALPLVGSPPPLGVGVAGARDPFDVAGTLARAAAAHPGLLVETAVFAVVALVLPLAHARGRWGAALVGAGMLVGTVVAVPSAPAVSLAFAAWLTAAGVALRARRA